MTTISAAESTSGQELHRTINWKGAFWVASGVPALVLFSIGGISATVGVPAFVVIVPASALLLSRKRSLLVSLQISVPVFANTWSFSGAFGNRSISDPSSPPTGSVRRQSVNQGCVDANCNSRAVARGVTRSCPLSPEPSKK